MQKHKRERNVNFTQEETDLLVSLAEAKKNIIENKKSDAATWQDKEKAWKNIAKAFNASSGSVFRDHKHLKLKYEAIKRNIRKKNAVMRAGRYKTSGGRSTAPMLTPAEQKVKEMILLSVEKNESCFDSNVVSPSSSTSGSIETWFPAKEKNFQLATEQTLSDDSSNTFIEISEQDTEPPRKKGCEVSKGGEAVQCNPKEKRPLDKLIEEKIEIAKIQKKIITEELEQKLIQRKILEKELENKNVMHELEKQHLLLKMELLKKNLREK